MTSLHMGDDASHLIRGRRQPPRGVLIATRTVKPADQANIDLGSYSQNRSPKGFMIDYEPQAESSASMVTKITTIKGDKEGFCRLVMFFANYSQRTITFKVWRL